MADLAITPAQVELVSGTPKAIQAGEAVTAGQSLYRKGSDGKAWKAISSIRDAAAAIGLALGDAAADQYVAYAPEGAVVDLGAGAAAAAGEGFAVSDTAGGLQPDLDIAAAEWVTRVCEAIGSNRVHVRIVKTGIQHAA